ncbi:tyrosine-type recombinase/integrase [Polynucleobacter sp. 31A-FELB]|uniref:tyrosine-type recombinase/integrase n=1 Tax=Polynucleobacter sp. 31A-FELB TaxID=2689096 RepID=UPI001C0AAD98|nr:site-specific integrase [Polynucleobacter sp. 31A-FELB]MBU3587821.1 tyrosine-type recombinase/integrase [Polynucleobacter sp. 31A-FELB]
MKIGNLRNQNQVAKFLNAAGVTRQTICDAQCKGLQLERLGLGRGRWRYRYKKPGRRNRQCLTLGDAPIMTLAQARELANKYRVQAALGHDPAEQIKESAKTPTFAQFIEQQYLPHVKSYKKSWDSDLSYLKNQILPVLGKKYLDEVTKKDIIDFHHGLRNKGYKPGTCNRSLVLLRYAFNLAIRWEVPGIQKNPTKDVPLFDDQEGKRDRFLTQEETQRLFEAVTKSDNPLLQYIIPMLILTGARKREVLDARWEDFDIDKRQWRIPVTKAGRPRYVPLSNGVLTLLANIPHKETVPWVFANPKTDKPYVSIYGSWNSARTSVGLRDVCIHSLRHSMASNLVNSGRSLYEVQRILGHTQIKTTQRYAHLSQDTLLDAVNAASEMAGSMVYAVEPVKPDQLGYRNV